MTQSNEIKTLLEPHEAFRIGIVERKPRGLGGIYFVTPLEKTIELTMAQKIGRSEFPATPSIRRGPTTKMGRFF